MDQGRDSGEQVSVCIALAMWAPSRTEDPGVSFSAAVALSSAATSVSTASRRRRLLLRLIAVVGWFSGRIKPHTCAATHPDEQVVVTAEQPVASA